MFDYLLLGGSDVSFVSGNGVLQNILLALNTLPIRTFPVKIFLKYVDLKQT